MVRHFPMPYPDESVYSIFVRYDKSTGNNNYFVTAKDLMGQMHLKINFSFANNLEFLRKKLPEGTTFTPEYFILNHTVLPIYKSFIPEERYENAVKSLKNGSITSALSAIGYTAGSLFDISGFKYCPECIEIDKKIYKKAYLHRTHQIDGNLVCSKHKSLLQVYDVPKIVDNIMFYDVDKLKTHDVKQSISNRVIEELYNLSCDIDILIDKYNELPDFDITREKYYSKIDDKGYFSKSGLVNQIELHKDFINYYSKEFLDTLKSNVDVNNESSWLRIITRRKVKAVHPIRNLLLIRFLFGNINNFIDYEWHKTFGIKETKSNSKVINNKTNPYNISLEEPYKNELLKLIKAEPNLSRREISRRLRKECIWLSNHEKEWLEGVLPKPLKHEEFYKNDRVDWNERDLNYYNVVKNVIYNILKNNISDRINITQISKHINYTVLNRDISKMPKTKALIEKLTETIPEFHKRKIRIALDELMKGDKKIKPYMILKKAHISDKYFHDYDDYINQLLEENYKNRKN
ncbi:TnsD family Tn7-like transposition protein [Candidatus Clostridium stratigraminis]|uniref:TnsD family Tn7-like transposition protein n=1 Tax=Candidatus Clostridium stratigraminis TaxID=3381661 RepID=A0ABW8T9N1_9CLOT